MPKLTTDEYVHECGNICPSCQSDDITGGAVEIDSSSAWRPVRCINCGASWNDVYELTAYSELAE